MNVLETATATATPKFKKGDLVLVTGKGFGNYAYGHMAVVVSNGKPSSDGIPVDVICRDVEENNWLRQVVPETDLRLVTESELFG